MRHLSCAPDLSGACAIARALFDLYPGGMDFTHVDVWIFDLDNTLYPPEMALFPQIEARMTAYVMPVLDCDHARADQLRDEYWRSHGTTLAGLMERHGVDPSDYLADVHDIDFDVLSPAPDLCAAIHALPGRKLIHTNADSTYARKVLAARGLDMFTQIFGVEETGYHPKPNRAAFDAVIAQSGIDPRRAAFFEDDPRNLAVPHELGMRTVLVGPRRGPDVVSDDAAGQKLPAHIDRHTRDLTAFLQSLIASRG